MIAVRPRTPGRRFAVAPGGWRFEVDSPAAIDGNPRFANRRKLPEVCRNLPANLRNDAANLRKDAAICRNLPATLGKDAAILRDDAAILRNHADIGGNDAAMLGKVPDLDSPRGIHLRTLPADLNSFPALLPAPPFVRHPSIRSVDRRRSRAYDSL